VRLQVADVGNSQGARMKIALKMVVGESAVTAASFFESAGRPSKPFGGAQQGNKLIFWEKDKGEQAFREHSRRIFTGECKELKRDSDSREETSGGKHVTRARSWWKRGDVSACADQINMECWVHQDIILDDDKANQSSKEAWEQGDNKDELTKDLQGPERQFWLGTAAGRLGCYDFPGET
jgi:hypothetical protein